MPRYLGILAPLAIFFVLLLISTSSLPSLFTTPNARIILTHPSSSPPSSPSDPDRGHPTNKTFDALEALFGPTIPPTGIVGQLFLADPRDGCGVGSLVGGEAMVDKIVVVLRGGPCTFLQKDLNAARIPGAKAVLIGDVERRPGERGSGGELLRMGPVADAPLPALFISHTTYTHLLSAFSPPSSHSPSSHDPSLGHHPPQPPTLHILPSPSPPLHSTLLLLFFSPLTLLSALVFLWALRRRRERVAMRASEECVRRMPVRVYGATSTSPSTSTTTSPPSTAPQSPGTDLPLISPTTTPPPPVPASTPVTPAPSSLPFSPPQLEKHPDCPICLEDYTPGELLLTLPCGHEYHKACVEPWLVKRRRVCPICKRDVIVGVGGQQVQGEGSRREGGEAV
ncbi:hypothetical protein YB2330_005819 [Saitoella coloradoensis]